MSSMSKLPKSDINPDQLLLIIGSKVRKLRKMQNKNYEAFAKEHNFNKVTLQRIESGQNFTMTSLIELLNILGVSLEEFFSDIL
jgi:transcriptional regulator with XRE-family HTH domain